MLRRSISASLQPPGGPRNSPAFRHRGKDVSRLEGFSDAVFGFALTLLVVSLDVPSTFDEMMDTLRDTPAFAICFIFLVHFWYMHYRFFRRFGLADVATVMLNTALLFVLLLYVYPLKFMFSVVIAMITGIGPKRVSSSMLTYADASTLFIVFGIGFVAIYLLFALLYQHAYARRASLELTAIEAHETLTGVAVNLACAGVGVASIVIAVFVRGLWLQLAGWIYCLTGFAAMSAGILMNRRGKRIRRDSTA
ncbi:MAG: TMEM175 family protein [Phycisphaerales bacterium]